MALTDHEQCGCAREGRAGAAVEGGDSRYRNVVASALMRGAPLVRFGEQFKKILASGVISTPAMAA